MLVSALVALGAMPVEAQDTTPAPSPIFRPLFDRKLGRQALAVLKPGQWSDLLERLREIDNPVVPAKPSKYALPVKRRGYLGD